MTREDLTLLLRQMEWADARMWRAVGAVPAAAGDGDLRTLLHHLHCLHHAFLQICRGEALSIPELESFVDLPALEAWARSYYPQAQGFLEDAEDDALRRRPEVPWAVELEKRFGPMSPCTVEDTFLQAFAHTAHHRGQVMTRLRGLGGEPPIVDFIAWVFLGKPDPDWAPPAP